MGIIVIIGEHIWTLKLGYWHLVLAIAMIGYFWPEKKVEEPKKWQN